MSFFDAIPLAPEDAIFGLNTAFQADVSPNKLNLGVGAYRTAEGKPWVLPSVKKAEEIILAKSYNKEYLPIDGHLPFRTAAAKLLFGEEIYSSLSSRISTSQTISGTGALRIGGDFFRKHFGAKSIYIPDPTWANHRALFSQCGLNVCTYTYYNKKENNIDIQGMLKDIKSAPENSVILLHACAHNPTGMDLNIEQWKQVQQAIKEGRHITFFDCAYQGFASGDMDSDAMPIRTWIKEGMECFVAQSFAKNMGLYAERVGCLHIFSSSDDIRNRVHSQVKIMIRVCYSNPPVHGALIADNVLNTPELHKMWRDEVLIMANRIKDMRQCLFDALVSVKAPGDWSHIVKQIGMFSYTGLNESQVSALTSEHHIYLTRDGRISMSGLNEQSCKQLAQAIKQVIEQK